MPPQQQQQRATGQQGRQLHQLPWGKLLLSIIVDIIGMMSYLIPGFGEAIDVIWSPVSFYIVQGNCCVCFVVFACLLVNFVLFCLFVLFACLFVS